MLLEVPIYCDSSGFESLILPHHSRYTCDCHVEEIDGNDRDAFQRALPAETKVESGTFHRKATGNQNRYKRNDFQRDKRNGREALWGLEGQLTERASSGSAGHLQEKTCLLIQGRACLLIQGKAWFVIQGNDCLLP